MDRETKQRLTWVKMYEATSNAGLVCRRCGISRPTLRKWWRRYQAEGIEGLQSRSRRPHHSPGQKVFVEQEQWIQELRTERRLGARRIQTELHRHYGLQLSTATIQKYLQRLGMSRLERKRWRRKVKRYEKQVPGERVQVDTCKIAPGRVQFTAIDDCTRFLVIKVYPARTAQNAVRFLDYVQEQMAFPIQRIQTDNGTEFTSYKFQDELARRRIKWRPIKPRKPHLNGKVERVQQTTLDELYATLDLPNLDDEQLRSEIEDWQDFYNWHRIHTVIGSPPWSKVLDLEDITPSEEEVAAQYNQKAEEWYLNRLFFERFRPPHLLRH
jgi:transposase InsO family protein